MILNKREVPIIALAGNPNVGKTSLFNALTGARQTVGNWPGVTVEHKSGHYQFESRKYEVIDLPGIYSLSGGTPDELVARNYILNEKPDLIVNIVDASNLERNLYLTVQLMELGAPILICLSMGDIAEQNGIVIDIPHLESHLGFQAIPVVLNKRFDAELLMGQIVANLESPRVAAQIHYDDIVETHLDVIWQKVLSSRQDHENEYPRAGEIYTQVIRTRWQALKLIEGDLEFLSQLDSAALELVKTEVRAIEKHRGQPAINVVADDRYGYIRGLVKDVVKRKKPGNWTFSDTVEIGRASCRERV